MISGAAAAVAASPLDADAFQAACVEGLPGQDGDVGEFARGRRRAYKVDLHAMIVAGDQCRTTSTRRRRHTALRLYLSSRLGDTRIRVGGEGGEREPAERDGRGLALLR